MSQAPFAPVFPIFNGYAPDPESGPRTLEFTAAFSANITSIDKNFEIEATTGRIGFVQSIWVNNASNTQPLIVTNLVTGQEVVFDAGSSGADPIFATNPPVFRFASTGQVSVKIFLLNIPLASYRSGPVTVNANVSPIQRGTWSDDSSTIAIGGTSQQAIAGNAARYGIVIQNPSSEIESLFVNFGAAASAADSIELTPGEEYTEMGIVTTQAINVVAATTGHVYIAKELA